jgi:hypothetical protein
VPVAAVLVAAALVAAGLCVPAELVLDSLLCLAALLARLRVPTKGG